MALKIPGSILTGPEDVEQAMAEPLPQEVHRWFNERGGHLHFFHDSPHGVNRAREKGYEFIQHDDLMSALPKEITANLHLTRDKTDGTVRHIDTKLGVCNMADFDMRKQVEQAKATRDAGKNDDLRNPEMHNIGARGARGQDEDARMERLEAELAALQEMMVKGKS